MERLRAKLASITATHGVYLDDTTSLDLHQNMEEEEQQVVHRFPRVPSSRFFGSNRRSQRVDLGKTSKQGMHWHPFMVKRCLYCCHQSSKAYEMVKESNRSGLSVDASCTLDILSRMAQAYDSPPR